MNVHATAKRRLVFTAKLAFGFAIVYWLLESGRLDLSIYRSLGANNPWFGLLAIFLAQGLSLTLLMLRWWLLLRVQGIPLSLGDAMSVSFRGMFAGLFMPGTLGLDGFRVVHLRRCYADQFSSGLASMLMDRALGLLGLFVLATICGIGYLWQDSGNVPMEVVAWSAGGLFALTFVLAFACGFVPGGGMQAIGRIRFLTRFVDALTSYKRFHGTLAAALGLSIAAHLLVIVASCLGLAALGVSFSAVTVAMVTPFIIIVRFIPLTPLGLGVSDLAGEELYRLAGLDGGAEVQMLLRATWVVALLACGLAYFDKRSHRPRA